MNTQPLPSNLFEHLGDPVRMRQIAGYDIFDPGLRTRLDAVAARSAQRLQATVSLISVILDSSQFILGGYGVSGWVAEAAGTPAEWALCTHTVLSGRPYCFADGRTDPVHAGNPLLAMTGLRSYAGVPLIDDSGQVLGAHCVIDRTVHTFTDVELTTLEKDAGEAMRILREYRIA
jgi:GAF domain-containing protein